MIIQYILDIIQGIIIITGHPIIGLGGIITPTGLLPIIISILMYILIVLMVLLFMHMGIGNLIIKN